MSAFKGGVQGSGKVVTRLGNERSGMQAFVNSWGAGVRVKAAVDSFQNPVIQVFATGGSNGVRTEILIATVRETKKGFKIDMEDERNAT